MKKMTGSMTATKDRSRRHAAAMLWAARCREEEILEKYGTGPGGLSREGAEDSRERHGQNVLSRGRRDPLPGRLLLSFVNPFTLVLLALAAISVFTDIVFAAPGERSYATVTIITAMVLVSGALRFVQETRSGNVAARLSGMIRTTGCGCRENGTPPG